MKSAHVKLSLSFTCAAHTGWSDFRGFRSERGGSDVQVMSALGNARRGEEADCI